MTKRTRRKDVCLKAHFDGREAKAGTAAWITFHNELRFHQALGYRTPMAVWREGRAYVANEGAVEMMDNAAALTTSPQQQKRAKALAA